MTCIRVAISNTQLIVTYPGRNDLVLGLYPDSGIRVPVHIWNDEVQALDVGDEAARWFTEVLGRPARLVYMPEDARRDVDKDYATSDEQTAFSDGFPILLANMASLDDLNAHLDQAVSIGHFRPNLVVSGALPYAEDGWSCIRLGNIELALVKPCSRCVVTTVDLNTGVKNPSGEPLRTLSRLRLINSKAMWGQNVLVTSATPGDKLILGQDVHPL